MPGTVQLSREALYRAMVEQALDALLLIGDENFVDCNPSAESLFDATREQLLSSSPIRYSAPVQADGRDSLSAAKDYIARTRAGQPQRFEWQSRKADGTIFASEVCLSLLEQPGATCIVAVVRDISERKRIEGDLRRQGEKLRTLLDNFPGGVSLLDSTLHVVACNREMQRLLDLPPSLFEGRTPSVAEVFQSNLERGEYQEFGGATPQERLDKLMAMMQSRQAHSYERTRADGSIIEVRSSPVNGGGFVTTFSDVTARRRAEKEFRRQSLFLEAVMANLPQGISVLDENLNLQLWNQGFLEVLDFTSGDVYQGVPFVDLLRIMAERGEYGEGDPELQIQERMSYARKFEAHRAERTRLNGSTHLIQGSPIYDEDKLMGFVTTYTDISDLKRAQDALCAANAQLEKSVADRTSELRLAQDDLIKSEKLAALGSLVAGVAHELNTPIGNSLLISSTIREKAVGFKQQLEGEGIRRSDLTNFLSEVQSAAGLVEYGLRNAADLVVSFKQVAVDQASSKRRRYNLSKVCQDVIATMTAKIRQASCSLELDIPSHLEMDSYPGPFDQVLSNLIGNAILHAFEGRTAGKIKIAARPLPAGMLEICFSDDGNGIPQEHLEHIFDPFFTTKLGHGGSGLGLHIVHNIVTTLLGGDIRVQSQPGAGTSFTLQLPEVAPQPGAEAGR